jgi:hypothetical protein
MINLSPGAGDPAEQSAAAGFWRAAIRRHVDLRESPPTAPSAPPRCRRCREQGQCAGRRRAERSLYGALRERWGGGGPGRPAP